MNFAAITRRIRRCESDVPAQIVLEHVIREAVTAEREACAEQCAALRLEWGRMKVGATDGRYDMMEEAATVCEDEIRARGNLQPN